MKNDIRPNHKHKEYQIANLLTGSYFMCKCGAKRRLR